MYLWLTLCSEKCNKEVCYPITCQQRECRKPVHTQMPPLPYSCHFVIIGWDLLPVLFVCTEHQQLHMMSLETSLETAHKVENSTKEQSSAAVEEYCRAREVNHYLCGFLIHPDTPWMGSSPDGTVYDPKGQPVFGLLEIKCPNVTSYVDCPYVKISEGTHTLRKSHPYFCLTSVTLLSIHGKTCLFRRSPKIRKSQKQSKKKLTISFFIVTSTFP